MSLKAKIEAVIYASEEPVTLAQLVSLLGEEAQAELDRADAAQQSLALEPQALTAAEAEAEAALEGAEVEPSLTDVAGEAKTPDVRATPQAAPAEAETAPPATAPETPGSDIEAEEADPDAADSDPAASVAEAPDAAASDEAEAAKAAARAEKARAVRLRAYFRTTLDRLIADYAAAESDRGLEIREVAGGFRFATKPEYHDAVRGFVKSLKPPLKLSLQALETLAVVAYKQPVTAPEVSEIRGVDSGGVLGSLMARKLVTTAGRKQVIGRPILYKTTKEFLLRFGLKDLAELPSIEEFEKMAGQMTEQEEIQMTDDMPETAAADEERRESDGEDAPPQPVPGEVIVDGRISGLPPRYDDAEDDPSAREAEIQESEG